MSQIQTKFLEGSAVTADKMATDAVTTPKVLADAITDTKIRLSNNAYIRARNAANSADVNMLKVNASDVIEFASFPQKSGTPSNADDLANKSYVDSVAGVADWEKETQVLDGTDITNQYVDLGFEAAVDTIQLLVRGAGVMLEGASYDYSVSYTGGVSSVTRITFLNDLATGGDAALVATDVLQIQYVKA